MSSRDRTEDGPKCVLQPVCAERSLATTRYVRRGGETASRVGAKGRTGMYFEIVRSPTGQYQWKIRGGNHEIMASSELMRDKASCSSAIAVVKRDAPGAQIIDRT